MITKFDELDNLASKAITYVIGTFDILHAGHIHFLEQAKAAGENHKLLVGIIPDAIVRESKGAERPFIHQDERATIIDALKVVDYVFIAPELPVGEVSRKVVDTAHPEYSAVSRDDWGKRGAAPEFAGTKLLLIDKIPDRSTTKIVQKIRK